MFVGPCNLSQNHSGEVGRSQLKDRVAELESCQTGMAGMAGHGTSWLQEQPMGFSTLLYGPADPETVCQARAAGSWKEILGKALKGLC